MLLLLTTILTIYIMINNMSIPNLSAGEVRTSQRYLAMSYN